MAGSFRRIAVGHALREVHTDGVCFVGDQAFLVRGGNRPSGRAAHATDPNFRVLYRQADSMPTGPQAKDAIAWSSSVFTSEGDDHEVALSAQKSGIRTAWGHRLFLLR
jgi:hypothetical protein